MDLSTLDTLLKSHISHLEGLYGQLGAPKETVPTKLQELHNALVGTVEQQRHSAEDEVKQVKERIEGLEATIARKRRQLSGEVGSSTSTTTTATATDTSETLLQRRERLEKQDIALERDVQNREKQLNKTLELLASYQSIVGPDFLASIDVSEGDLINKTDLSLPKLAALEKKIAQCKEEVTRREQVFQALLQDILELWNELGISPSSSSASTSTHQETDTEDVAFDLEILHTAQALSHENSKTGMSNTVQDHSPSLKPDSSTLSKLSSRKESLETIREERMQHIQDLYDQLYALWSRLGVSDEEADDFVEVWKGCEPRCIEAYEQELARMMQVKADNMAIFIQREREDIAALWDALYYSDMQRANFTLMDSQSFNEEVLLAHEIEKRRLLEEQQSKEVILHKLTKYFGLLDEMRQLEESANDPSRLTGRGQRGDPGRLLREEKQRKRVAKEKPKLEADLLRAIPEWEAHYGEAFMISGSRLLDDLSAKVESEQAARPPSRRARTPAPPPSVPTKAAPSTQAIKRTVPPTSNTATNSAAVSNSKRARLGTSAGLATSTRSVASQGIRANAVPATPCPQPSAYASTSSSHLMLVASEARPATSNYSESRQTVSSRLPLKTTFPASQQPQPVSWHSIGVGAGKSSMAAGSLFSPPGQPLAHQSHRAAFRPRPSIVSVATTCGSGQPSSIFSGRSSRIASTATTMSSTSEGYC